MNAYAEIMEQRQGKSMMTVYRAPGLKLWQTLPGSGPVRGLYYAASQDHVYAVQGTTLYDVGPTGVVQARGTLSSSTGPVHMDENRVDLAIADGAARYSLTFADNTFAANTSVSFTAADRVGFLDGYFVYLHSGDQDFFWSDLYSTDVQDLSHRPAEGRPDPLVSLLVPQREVWLFGTETTQPFYSTGDPDDPFGPIGSVFIAHGTVAAQSPAIAGETVIWLSRNREGQGLVVQASGQSARPVSTHAVAEAIQRYSRLDDAIGWAQQQEGHLFYWLTFPTAKATWVLDLVTGLWHERGWRNPATGFIERHRANCYTFGFGKHLVGDYENGKIYALDMDTYSDAGEAQVLEAIFPPLFDGDNSGMIEQPWLVLECETGVGLDGGVVPGTDPQVALLISDDGGHLYTGALSRSLGPIGKHKHIVEWRALGASYDRRCKIQISDPVKVAITGVLTEIRPLAR
jgi:hypothetical protein